MSDWISWLDKQLSRPAPAIPSTAPRTVRERLQSSEHRSNVARQMAGVGPGKLPPKGTAERKHYESSMSAIRRAEKTPGTINPRTGKPFQTRPAGAERVRQASIAVDRRERNIRSLRQTGGNITGLRAEVSVNGYDPRERDFPDVFMPPNEWDEVLDALAAGQSQRAEDLLNIRAAEAKGLYRGASASTNGITSVIITDVLEGRIE